MKKLALLVSLLLAIVGVGLFRSTADLHRYEITITRNQDPNGPPFVADKDTPDDLWEVDYIGGLFTTTFTIDNRTGEPISVQIVETQTFGTCHVKFNPANPLPCDSRRVEVPDEASTVVIEAGGENMWPWQYHDVLPIPGWPRYRAELRVGRPNEALLPVDPELEIERDYDTGGIVLLLIALLLVFYAWRGRVRTQP